MSQFRGVFCFFSGLVAGLNLAHMYPSTNYDASWTNVGICILIVVGFMVISELKRKE